MNATDPSDKEIQDLLWQVEVAKQRGISTVKAMNFINLSREAQTFGNKRLAESLRTKARDLLFNDRLSSIVSEIQGNGKESMAKAESAMMKARTLYSKGDVRGAYDSIADVMKKDEPPEAPTEAKEEERAQLYSNALEAMQKSWLKMKQEEAKGKDITGAKNLIKDAKKCLNSGDYGKVNTIFEEILREIQTPQERLTEEAQTTIEEIAKTLRALFPEDPRSPKERFFKRQIEDLIERSRHDLTTGAIIESINSSRKAKEILSRLEQETIKGEIPKQIIELRSSLDELRGYNVDISYEDYLLKQIESTFWNGNYIEARKTANKLWSILNNARIQYRMHELNDSFGDLNSRLKEMVGKEGYLEAREYLDKAKVLMEQKAFDMARDFLDRASSVLDR